MKSLKTWFWIVTGLMGAFIVLGAIIDVSMSSDAIKLITTLGYPVYFVRFIGVMKLLGIAAVLYPQFPKLKEWAYAGLTFDTGGALFSHFSAGSGPSDWGAALLGLVLVLASYTLYTLRSKNVQPQLIRRQA
jgi:DoxX-like family